MVCKVVFHADTICLGIRREAVSALLATNDGSLSFSCCKCRISSNAGGIESFGSAVSQILMIVGELVREVRSSRQNKLGNFGGVGLSGQNLSVKEEVLNQVRELKERDKRADSIIIRGLPEMSLLGVQEKFSDICKCLQLQDIKLVDIVKIGPNNMYRARIPNNDLRKLLFVHASKLRNHPDFSRVYVNRDLTYHQRQVLVARRNKAHRTELFSVSGANAAPIGANHTSRSEPVFSSADFPALRISSSRGVGGRRGGRGGSVGVSRGGRGGRGVLVGSRRENSSVGVPAANRFGPGQINHNMRTLN